MSAVALGQYVGRVSSRWAAEAVLLAVVVHEKQRVNAWHGHQAAFVTLNLGGEYSEKAAQRSVRFDRFTAIYHPPALDHEDSIGAPGVRLLMFEFDPELLEDAGCRRDHARSLRDISGSSVAWNLLALYRGAASDADPLSFESRAIELVGKVVPLVKSSRDIRSLLRARDYVHDRFRDQLRMRDIADAAGVHPVHLGQSFRREYGETVGDCVKRLRVRSAADALLSTDASIAAVAYDHGFCDQSHFQRVFRRLTGTTPAAFRRVFGRRP